jgi:hypothetical protein
LRQLLFAPSSARDGQLSGTNDAAAHSLSRQAALTGNTPFASSDNCYSGKPKRVAMATQNENGFPTWFRDQRKHLNDPLIAALSRQRDIVVHRSMLAPQSSGTAGITEGRGLKAGLMVPIHPLAKV